MKKLIIICLIACFVLGLEAKTTVTNLDENRIKVVWELPAWQLTAQNGYLWLNAAGMAYSNVTGAPLIPYDEVKAAIPPGGSITISTSKISEETINLENRLLPVPEVIQTDNSDENKYTLNETLYAGKAAGTVITLPAQTFRSMQFVPLRINPFSYDGNRTLKVCKSIEFIITITGDTRYSSRLAPDDLTSMMLDTMVNPAQARAWLSSTRPVINYADFRMSDQWVKIETDKDGMFKIAQSQLSMLPLNDIDPQTFRMFTTGGEVQSGSTENAGPVFREIPIIVNGEADGSFDTGDYILFYGRDRDGIEMNQNVGGNLYYNPYSQNGCYWLTFGGEYAANRLRINMADSEPTWQNNVTTTPAVVRNETEVYQRAPVGFDWFMSKMYGTQNNEYHFSLDLEDVDNTQSQTLSMLVRQEYLRNGSSTLHKIHLNVNDVDLLNDSNSIQEWAWTGQSPITITHTGNYFQSGNNSVQINVLRSSTDNLMLDYLQVAYQKNLVKRNKLFVISIPSTYSNHLVRYNFTGASTGVRVFKTLASISDYNTVELPVVVSGTGFYFVGAGDANTRFQVVQDVDYLTPASIQQVEPTDLAQETQQFDNVIITPPEFENQASELVSLYQDKWHKRSKVVKLNDIFNQFNGGMPDPAAIRNYLAFAMSNYPAPALTSATLLGSGTNDWRNYSGQSDAKNRMICYQKLTSTSDDYFANLNTPQYPELAIGRYPAKNTNDMNNMLNNLTDYVDNPQPGLWRNTLLFMSDDEYNGGTSGEYYHSAQMQSTASSVNRGVLVDKLFAIEYDFDEFQNKPKARDDMFKSINDGKLMWYYIGHGAYDKLGSEDYLNGAVDMNKFNNPGKLPLFIAASCDVGEFDSFSFDCLGEKTVLMDNKGAIASITGTRETLAYDNVPMLTQFYQYAVNLRNPTGYSLVMAKIAYTGNNTNDEKYVLLGDPLLPIIPPQRDSTISVTTAAKDVILHSREQVTLHGTFSVPGFNETTVVQAYNCDISKTMGDNTPYTKRGGNLYKGNSSLTNSEFNTSFIIPDDVTNGNSALVMAYLWNPTTKTDYINYLFPITLSDTAVAATNTDAPLISMHLGSGESPSGSTYVGTNTVLTANISDLNGINTTDSPGHSILLILDHNSQPVNVTSLFSYNTDSFTTGSLTYPLSGLTEGQHTLQMIAFDNFNRPSVGNLEFNVIKSGKFAIEDFLPYPNPMEKEGWFTFVLNDNAEVSISIYTIRGKKIRTIRTTAFLGFNKVSWDGKDADGDYPANNTYFVKITAQSLLGKGKAEKTEKLVIYH